MLAITWYKPLNLDESPFCVFVKYNGEFKWWRKPKKKRRIVRYTVSNYRIFIVFTDSAPHTTNKFLISLSRTTIVFTAFYILNCYLIACQNKKTKDLQKNISSSEVWYFFMSAAIFKCQNNFYEKLIYIYDHQHHLWIAFNHYLYQF